MPDNIEAVSILVWIINLALSKALTGFTDPIMDVLLLVRESLPVLVRILQCMYLRQSNKIIRDVGQGKISLAQDGLQQTRGLRPRLFCAVLPWALRESKNDVRNMGFNFMDGRPNLLDLTFR